MTATANHDSLQEKLLLALQSSKSNAVNTQARSLKPYMVNAMEEIRLNQGLKFAPDQLLKEILRRCVKNAGNNPITAGNAKKLSIDVQNESSVNDLLAKHQRIVSDVQDRIQHDVELAMKHIGLSAVEKKVTVQMPVNVDEDDDDFFVEEAPPLPTIIRHK